MVQQPYGYACHPHVKRDGALFGARAIATAVGLVQEICTGPRLPALPIGISWDGTYNSGWWYTYPSENMKVSWDDYSQYME